MWKQQLSERTAEVVGQAVSEVVPAHTPHGPGYLVSSVPPVSPTPPFLGLTDSGLCSKVALPGKSKLERL